MGISRFGERSTFDAVPDFTPLHLATALWARAGEDSLKQHEASGESINIQELFQLYIHSKYINDPEINGKYQPAGMTINIKYQHNQPSILINIHISIHH